MASRENSEGEGTHSYQEGRFTITLMGDDRWYVFVGKSDTGEDFGTLRQARHWCKTRGINEKYNPAKYAKE